MLGKILIIILMTFTLEAQDFFVLQVAKTKAYVNEIIPLTLTLEFNSDDPIIDTNFEELVAKSFWVNSLGVSKPYRKGDKSYIDFRFEISPQSAGEVVIPKQSIRIARREKKTNFKLWSKLFSNQINMSISPLPKGISIQGDYTITASVDKNKTETNRPINLKLQIKGDGNIADIEPFKLGLKEQLVFSDAPTVKGNTFTQKFSILSQKSFTIKPIVFRYFNTRTKLVEKIQTKEIKINIKSSNKASSAEKNYLKYIYGVIGFILGGMVLFFVSIFKRKRIKRAISIDKKIKKAKSDKVLYELLLPYSCDSRLKDTMQALEENIYHNGNNKIDKKMLVKILNLGLN